MNWKDVYKLPLNFDGIGYAWSKNDVMSITFDFNVDLEDCKKVVKAINGEEKLNIKDLRYDGCDFYQNDQLLFMVRGWGHLTGIGGLNLPSHKAVKIQDGFIKYIYEKLSLTPIK